MIFQFKTSRLSYYKDDLYIIFIYENNDNHCDDHYFVISRDLDTTEDILPDLKHIYIELDEQTWGEYGGFKSINLNRNQFIIYLDESVEQYHIDRNYEAIQINFECNDSKFQELCEILREIMEGHEDKLNLTGL